MKKPRRTPCEYRGWHLEGVGGFLTSRHFWAKQNGRSFHNDTLHDLVEEVDALENGTLVWGDIDEYRKTALFQ